ncbi:phospholipase A and acyltransferase 5 [Orycteropus afer afer]|uniref:Phospholipase A and acyltransferase 5 n=1 Tax=Orycteropus afer afer TaxID=1230840 RepID=A0A8B7A5G2_ORYAF|nr:phospholipase A and acyltransferase 5 [Orycteropus afer afer]
MGLSPAAAGGEHGLRLSRFSRSHSRTASKASGGRQADVAAAPAGRAENDPGSTFAEQAQPRDSCKYRRAAALSFSPSPPFGPGLNLLRGSLPQKKQLIVVGFFCPVVLDPSGPILTLEMEALDLFASRGKPKPRPGDLIEIFRIGYEHWAIYVEDDYVVHLASPCEEFEAGSITSVFSNRAVVKYSRLEDVLHGCSWKINNKLDGTYLPLPVDKIIQRTKKMINKTVYYSLIEGNCEHFVNDLRYGVPRSQQVEHALMEGAKAAGAVISAVVDSIRPSQ